MIITFTTLDESAGNQIDINFIRNQGTAIYENKTISGSLTMNGMFVF
jgi:hypothetical protein